MEVLSLVNMVMIYVGILLTLLLFLKVSGISLSKGKITLFSIVAFFIFSLSAPIIYIVYPLYFVSLAFYLEPKGSHTLTIFYGLLPIIISNLFRRSIRLFIVPLLFSNLAEFDSNPFYLDGLAFIGIFLSYFFLSAFNYDFSRLKKNINQTIMKKIVIPINISMILYYAISQGLIIFEHYDVSKAAWLQKALLLFYLVLFFIFLSVLDRYLKKEIQKELMLQKEAQIQALSKYSHHIETLYNEIRSFRHDYINILTSLKLGIENKDLASIEKIYHQVLEESGYQLQDNHYDIARLANIQNDAIKSVLSAKLLEAQNKHITVSVEIPEALDKPHMDLLDFITILSILCDNAIEAALEAPKPKIDVAFFKRGQQMVFIIQNSTKEEQIDINWIYKEGYSSKGRKRGLGLAKLNQILRTYPKVYLRTSSQEHLFRQNLTL